MSRIAKWKLEKTKVKVVFRLQFHATHIPQTGWDKVFISFIPADSGKATAKTTKANVRNGTCKWADPIYETTRLLQDIKTKQYDEKFYKLVVAMGSSRSSILGEANINLADYADALKPSVVALPLHGCDSGTILHVTVQLLTSKTGFREFEQQRELRERGLETSPDQNSPDESAGRKVSSSGEAVNDHMDKVNARVRFKKESKELPSLEEEVGLNEEYADSAVGFDGSSNTSESLYAEKHDVSSALEIDSLKSTTSGDLGGLSFGQSPRPDKGDPSDNRFLAQGTNDWVHGWSSDYSVDNDLAIAYEENSRLRASLEVAESSILELKLEVGSLQSHADEIGVEAQQFAQQLAAEIASGEELEKEVSLLKSECLKFRDDLEHLKHSKLSPPFISRESIETDQDRLFQELQLGWLKGLLLVEDKIRELQNKTCFGFHEGDFRFLHPDLEALLGVLQDLKQGTGQAISGLNLTCVKEIREMNLHKNELVVPGTGFDADLYQPEGMLHCLKIPSLVSHESDSVDAMNAMKGKLFELLRELDESKAERESVARKMDQMECYYEALVQELEETQRQMMVELQNLRNEHSTCMYTITSSKAEMETMRQEMDQQIIRFAEDKLELDSLNKDLERRAITAEAALKRARLNYSIAVDHLQKDLELLSFQVLSMFETNEKLIRQAFADSSLPNFQGYPEMAQNQRLDSNKFHAAKIMQCQNLSAGIKKQYLGGDILSDDLKRSLCLQEGLYQKVEEEIYEMHLVNVCLDIFSKTLQESLLEASSEFRFMKDNLSELTQQLELSAESKELLMLRLQAAMDDVHSLNDYKATCNAKCNDMALQNQILEENLQNVTHENRVLTQKITEWESLMTVYRSYERKYKASTVEKLELENLLNKKALENGNLQNEIFSLQEDLKAVRTTFDELASAKENLQNTMHLLQDKLWNLLASYDKKYGGLSFWSQSFCQDLESKDLAGVVLQLEELQHNAYKKILQLMEEKKGLADERDLAQMSLSTVESDNLIMKHKFEHDVRGMVDKLDVSNSLLQKLELEIEAIDNRLKSSSEAEERYAQQHRELLSDLDCLEVELQQVTSRNKDLAQEILALDTESDDLGRCQLTIAALKEEKDTLIMSLQDKTDESDKLVLEVNNLKESLQSLHDELHMESSSRDKLEITVKVLTSELDEKHSQLQYFDKQKAELIHLQQLVSDLESKKSSACHHLLHTEECLKSVQEECSSLETQLSEMHEILLATDVRLILTRTQYEAWIEELVQQLHSSDHHLLELRKKHLHEEMVNNRSLVSEAHYIEENARLGTSLDSLNSELEASLAENRVLLDRNSVITSELEECKNRAENMLATSCVEKSQHALDVGRLEQKLVSSEKENARLLTSLDSLKSELEASLAENRVLLDRNSVIATELGECKNRAENMVATSCVAKSQHALDVGSLEQKFVSSEEENARLLTSLDSLKSELEASLAENRVLLNRNSVITTELEECRNRAENMVATSCVEKSQHALDVGRLEQKFVSSEEENARLLTILDSLKSELEASLAENRVLLDRNSVFTTELEECKTRAENMVATSCVAKSQHALDVGRLEHKLVSSEEEVDNLIFYKEELEVKYLVLTAKLEEQRAHITLLEGYDDDLIMLQKQCNELSQRLSEQVLKTEEFKNLAIHLKELKDKAESECLQARDKREPEGPPAAMQDSLRIAFIKEQHETKLQELKQQLSISKKHSEEMLWKLQDAIDEVENRKKSEASHLKTNEELGFRILELEDELHSALSEKRELVNACDLMRAEKDCSLISLECCKEEKQQLEASLQKCNQEKSKIALELTLMEDLLESSRSHMNIQKESNDGLVKADGMSDEPVVGNLHQKYLISGIPSNGRGVDMAPCNGPTDNQFPKLLDQDNSMNCEEAEYACAIPIDKADHASALMNMQHMQDSRVFRGVNGIPSLALVNQEDLLPSDTKHIALTNDHFKAQSIKSSMDHLNKELERMKHENLHLPEEDNDFYSNFPGLQRELMQLHKANEELGSICPLFNEFSCSGNALERVLALEIELAEALQAKKKSSINFQSSFLRQHSDEEAVFQSFRDINELIKDMLEIKGKNTSVESELKDMHDRYSQLSLQFAEVEGERQKLMMTLKNVRASKKALLLDRSSSASLGENTS